jgi:hypothetical protein
MADNNPITPGGAVPPRPAEAAKVQPKKETVRISLPPKPSSSPTIKLPTLPAGGPAAPIGAAPGAVAAPAAAPAPAAPRPPTASGGAPLQTAAAAAASRPPTATGSAVTRPPGAPGMPAGPRPAVPAARKVSGLDVGLGIAAAVIGLGAVVSIVLLLSVK